MALSNNSSFLRSWFCESINHCRIACCIHWLYFIHQGPVVHSSTRRRNNAGTRNSDFIKIMSTIIYLLFFFFSYNMTEDQIHPRAITIRASWEKTIPAIFIISIACILVGHRRYFIHPTLLWSSFLQIHQTFNNRCSRTVWSTCSKYRYEVYVTPYGLCIIPRDPLYVKYIVYLLIFGYCSDDKL